MIRPRSTLPVLLAVLIAAAGCSSGDDDSSAPSTTRSTTGTTAPARPAGPAADLATELTGGNGPYMGVFLPLDLGDAGYEQAEYAASGTATSYRATGPLTGDGQWTFAPDATAPYRTRVLVRRPADETKFSGTVVVEWLNVTGGVEFDPEWWTSHEEMLRRGDAWVGVSAQRIGVEGGPVRGAGRRRRPRRRGRAGRASRRSIPNGTGRSSIPATASRSTCTRRSPARFAPGCRH